MKKIIILIAILCNFGLCDTVVKIYNKTTGNVVATYNTKMCSNDLLHIKVNTLVYDITSDTVNLTDTYVKFPEFFVYCDKKSTSRPFGSYNTSLFTYTIERIEMSLK